MRCGPPSGSAPAAARPPRGAGGSTLIAMSRPSLGPAPDRPLPCRRNREGPRPRRARGAPPPRGSSRPFGPGERVEPVRFMTRRPSAWPGRSSTRPGRKARRRRGLSSRQRYVPFLLPRSSTVAPSRPIPIRACRRDTDSSSIQTAASPVPSDQVLPRLERYLAPVPDQAVDEVPLVPRTCSAARARAAPWPGRHTRSGTPSEGSRGRRASSPSAARSSTTRSARFDSETWTSGQRRGADSTFETAAGRESDQQLEQRERLGRNRRRSLPPEHLSGVRVEDAIPERGASSVTSLPRSLRSSSLPAGS